MIKTQQLKKKNLIKFDKVILWSILLFSVILRFYLILYIPHFNWDENALLNEIEHATFKSAVLFPLNHLGYHQSAPPLFCLFVKLLSYTDNYYYYKLFVFILSSLVVMIFYSLISKVENISSLLRAAVLFAFVFNPSIIENTSIIKQYVFDILGIFYLYNFISNIIQFNKLKSTAWAGCFLILLSNIFLILLSIVILYLFINLKIRRIILKQKTFLYSYLINVVIFIIYFMFFYSVDRINYIEVKNYMYKFWFGNFEFTLNYFFSRIIIICKVFIKLFSVYKHALIFWMLIMLFYLIYYKEKIITITRNWQFVFFCLVILIHAVLDLLKIYPFVADRFIIYICCLFFLVFTNTISHLDLSKQRVFAFLLILIGLLNIKFIFYREQDYNRVALNVPSNSIIYVSATEISSMKYFKRNLDWFKLRNVEIRQSDCLDTLIYTDNIIYQDYFGTEVGEVDIKRINFNNFNNVEYKKLIHHHILGSGVIFSRNKYFLYDLM